MAVEDQVIILYTLVNKYLIDVELEKIQKFQKEFLEFINIKKTFIVDEIRKTGQI